MTPNRPTVNLALWSAQWSLSATLFLGGLLKAGLPADVLEGRLHLAAGAPAALEVVGALEVVLALALVIPAATRFVPGATPVGAGCAALALASGALGWGWPFGSGRLHLDLALAALAAAVAWGRVVLAPLAAIDLAPAPGEGWRPEAPRPAAILPPLRRPAQVGHLSHLPPSAA